MSVFPPNEVEEVYLEFLSRQAAENALFIHGTNAKIPTQHFSIQQYSTPPPLAGMAHRPEHFGKPGEEFGEKPAFETCAVKLFPSLTRQSDHLYMLKCLKDIWVNLVSHVVNGMISTPSILLLTYSAGRAQSIRVKGRGAY